MSKQDGGPAFPVQEPLEKYDDEAGKYVTVYQPTCGMSLRDYFAAHAPKKPQPWFQPTLRARPEPVYDHEHPTDNCWECMPTNWKDRENWKGEYDRARLIQWPYAWADEQLKSREQD